MSEYIEREAVTAMLKRECSPRVMAYLVDGLCKIPAADVRPVVRAKWTYTNMSRLVCSNCGSPVAFALKEDGWHEGDFCPNCGADMRESKQESKQVGILEEDF